MEKVLQKIEAKLQQVDTLEKRLMALDESVASLAKTVQELTRQKSQSSASNERDRCNDLITSGRLLDYMTMLNSDYVRIERASCLW